MSEETTNIPQSESSLERALQHLPSIDDGTRRAAYALLACSLALIIDDHTADSVIRLSQKVNASGKAKKPLKLAELLARVKSLACVEKAADGVWFVNTETRKHLVWLAQIALPHSFHKEVRALLANAARERATRADADSPAQKRALFEAAFHDLFSIEQRDAAGKQLLALWQREPDEETRSALARMVDSLAPEVELFFEIAETEVKTEEAVKAGQYEVYKHRQARFEAAYHRALIPGKEEQAAGEFMWLWLGAGNNDQARAELDAMAYLFAEIKKYARYVPRSVELLAGLGHPRGGEAHA